VWAATAVAIVLILAGAAYFLDQREMRARLMRADPETIADDAALRAFAVAYARPVYARNCAGCHGEDMRGDPGYGVANLTAGDWLYGDGRVSQIERTILFGSRASNGRTQNFADMPAFGQPVPYKRYDMESLEPGEIRDVTEFLLAAAGRGGDKAAAARGARIFADKGQCFDCHASDAKGDTAIGAPNLVDDKWLHGTGRFEDIYEVIAYGSSGVCPAWYERLSPVEIRALAVLVHEASRRATSAVHSRSPAYSGAPAG
jgi:cytochrome c oxidase cbb3-type subunit 3